MSGPAILCVHPNGELYGSDRVFIQSVRAFRARWPDARITVVLPVEGPLAQALRAIESDVRVEPLFVLRRAKLGRTIANLLALVPHIVAARRRIAAHDLTYVSTVVLLDYLLASRWARRGRLIHVHELPTGRARAVFAQILRAAGGRLAFISAAVRDAFPELRGRPHAVIWNGTADRPAPAAAPRDGRPLHLLLIGRFNAWKGQTTLIEAVARLSPVARAGLKVRLVGSVYEDQRHFADDIHAAIDRHGLGDTIEVHGFDPVPDAHYAWADVVAVPSTRPEPFGLVAIEAMAAARAVIAAGHGGLAEIVADGETGTLVTPGDADALARAIACHLDDPALAARQGAAGRARFEREFREDVYMRRMADAADAAIVGSG